MPPPAGPAELPDVAGDDPETAALGAEDQARLAAAAIDAAGDFPVYGFFTSGVSTVAVVTSAGIASEQTTTDVTALAVAATPELSGYADATSWRVADVDPAAVAREAVEKAHRTADAREIDAGRYRAVLDLAETVEQPLHARARLACR